MQHVRGESPVGGQITLYDFQQCVRACNAFAICGRVLQFPWVAYNNVWALGLQLRAWVQSGIVEDMGSVACENQSALHVVHRQDRLGFSCLADWVLPVKLNQSCLRNPISPLRETLIGFHISTEWVSTCRTIQFLEHL